MSERLVVVWRVTTRCNLACGFCAYDRRLPLSRRDASEATARALGQALAAERGRTGRDIHVSFLGGEPWLWPHFPAVARDFKERGLSLGVTTNGTTLSKPAALELLLECFDELTVSLDGLAQTHDRLRGWPGGHDIVLKALAKLLAQRAAKPRVRVNTVLMRDNIAELAELCRALANLGVDELSFNRLGGRDRPEFFAEHRLRPERLALALNEVEALRRELPRLRILGSPQYGQRLLALERDERAAVADCQPGQSFLFVDELGQVAPCSFSTTEYGEPVGDVAALPSLFSERQLLGRARSCDDCQSTHVFGKFRGA